MITNVWPTCNHTVLYPRPKTLRIRKVSRGGTTTKRYSRISASGMIRDFDSDHRGVGGGIKRKIEAARSGVSPPREACQPAKYYGNLFPPGFGGVMGSRVCVARSGQLAFDSTNISIFNPSVSRRTDKNMGLNEIT